MPVALGIDTGGTYTDAVLVDHSTGAILAGAKSLTTHDDLAAGITGAMDEAFAAAAAGGQAPAPEAIDLVGLSTTLATNAIVEDQGTEICLILVGYDSGLIRNRGFQDALVTRDVVYIRGGHDGQGEETAPLDEDAVREVAQERSGQVQAFAVSAYFGVRNPAHELRVRELIESSTGLPVTCGHELTSQLDSVRRATTTALNARLIPMLRELIQTVRATLRQRGIRAPLMIVKGDGSLVQAEWAMQRPIETILSGPAASVVGAWHLAGRRDGWVVDVGGTTTDIAVLRHGRPRLDAAGARVGRWRTMIETVDVHTAGLGGDSHVRVERDTAMPVLGPRRAIPLCQLAAIHPDVTNELRRQLEARQHLELGGVFTLARRLPPALPPRDRDLLQALDSRPRSLAWLVDRLPQGLLILRQIDRLENRQLAQRAGFTPTDALHVLGRFSRWNTEAARLGAQLLAMQAGCSAEAFCHLVVETFAHRLVRELATKALSDEGTVPDWELDTTASALLHRALHADSGSMLHCTLQLQDPIVAVGAPVEAYLPRTAEHLRTGLTIPEHADVANAVGAVVKGVVQRLRVLIRPHDVFYRFHLPEGVQDFVDIEQGIERTTASVTRHLRSLARQAGAAHAEIQVTREDRTAPDGYGGDGRVFVESELVYTAVGGPGLQPVQVAGSTAPASPPRNTMP